jgi:hypothetical protein
VCSSDLGGGDETDTIKK